ncbi:MAG: metal-dependent hydrolase [Clostridiales bacterium]|jgi:L-ascorbate metabolism protein UlaG (beta-lactamase superfamily)|nr:metal-dependent hydrolase [Clostridiales bacterium]
MIIKYLGHSCLLIESSDNSVIIDPFLSSNPQNKIKVADIHVSAVLVTHGHMDHVGDALEIATRSKCPIIVIDELGKHFMSKDKTVKIHPMSIGGSYQFDWGKVKMTQALHGIGVEMNEVLSYSMPVGFIINIEDKLIYHPGDTGLFGDMEMFGNMYDFDFVALPIGGNFTMDISDSIVAAKLLKAKNYIPIHYNTFDIIKQDVEVWKKRMSDAGLNATVMQYEDVFRF